MEESKFYQSSFKSLAKKDFSRLKGKKTRRFRTESFLFVYAFEASEHPTFKLGTTLQKKHLKSAVKRNFVKRRIKECFRSFFKDQGFIKSQSIYLNVILLKPTKAKVESINYKKIHDEAQHFYKSCIK